MAAHAVQSDEAVLDLPSLGCTIPLRNIYAETDLLYGDDDAEVPTPEPA
jgi:hypothetical protein